MSCGRGRRSMWLCPPVHGADTSNIALRASDNVGWPGSLNHWRRPQPLVSPPSHFKVWGCEGGQRGLGSFPSIPVD